MQRKEVKIYDKKLKRRLTYVRIKESRMQTKKLNE